MAYCKRCKKEVEPELHGKKYLCPDCQKFLSVSDEEKVEPQVVVETKKEDKSTQAKEILTEQEGAKKIVTMGKNIRYDASDLHMGEILINLGFAKDLNDLSRKNMKLAFSLMNMGAVGKNFNTMELNETNDPNEMIDKSLKQQLLQAQIENMKKGNEKGGSDPLSTMMLMRMMENQDKGKSSGDNGFMNNLVMMQMMQAMSKPREESQLQREIADLKHQMQLQQMMNQQQQMQQGNTSSQEFMQRMEEIRSERDRSIKEAEIAAQQERDKNLQMAFDNRRIELENRLQNMEKEMKQKSGGQMATTRIKEMQEEIKAIKEMSKILGDKDKTTSENIMEGLTNVANTVGPPLVEVLKQKNQPQIVRQLPPEPGEYQMVDAQGQPVDLQTEQPVNVAPPAQENPEGMTTTEREMSNTMSDIYLKKR